MSDVVADVVLVQPPGDELVVRIHLDGPGVRVAVDLTGVQAWSLAGVLIDATVTYRQASTEPAASSAAPPAGIEAPPAAGVPAVRVEPVRAWLLRHRAIRSPRRVRSVFRCPRPTPPPAPEPGDEQPETGPWW